VSMRYQATASEDSNRLRRQSVPCSDVCSVVTSCVRCNKSGLQYKTRLLLPIYRDKLVSEVG
jgi:hypothetical protein